ncbi:hypothetical protein ACLB2K_048013 [Fragaria x ananassa]
MPFSEGIHESMIPTVLLETVGAEKWGQNFAKSNGLLVGFWSVGAGKDGVDVFRPPYEWTSLFSFLNRNLFPAAVHSTATYSRSNDVVNTLKLLLLECEDDEYLILLSTMNFDSPQGLHR